MRKFIAVQAVALAAASCMSATPAFARSTIGYLKVEPSKPRITSSAGVDIKITIFGGVGDADVNAVQAECGLRVQYGDNILSDDVQVGAKGFPVTVTKHFDKGGAYKIWVYGVDVGDSSACWDRSSVVVKIQDDRPQSKSEKTPAQLPAPQPSAKPSPQPEAKPSAQQQAIPSSRTEAKPTNAPRCPDGYTLVPGSATTSGSFTCQRNATINCGPGLVYFDDGISVGCRKAE